MIVTPQQAISEARFDMSDLEYRKAPGLSQSTLKKILRSPAHFADALKNPTEPTDDMRLGSVFDRYVFQRFQEKPEAPQQDAGDDVWTAIDWLAFAPDHFAMRIAVKPEGHDGRTKEGKEWKAANIGKILLTAEQMAKVRATVVTIQRMDANLMRHPDAAACFAKGRAQVSVFAPYALPDGTLVQLKGRFDFLPDYPADWEGSRAIVDLKSTYDARWDAFERKVIDLQYYFQAEFYRMLWRLVTGEDRSRYALFAVEKEAPCNVECHDLSDDGSGNPGDSVWQRAGAALVNKAITTWAACERGNDWSGYAPGVKSTKPRGWVAQKLLAEAA